MEPINKNYFTQETEDAVILYNNTLDIDIKNKIYNDKIHYAFFKLTENLIHTFKFYYTDVDNLEDLQFEVIQFFLEKMHLFDQKKSINRKLKKYLKERYPVDHFINKTILIERIYQKDIDNYLNNLFVGANSQIFITDKECQELKIICRLPKAYSYFGTIGKRYLIIYNKKNYQKKIESINIGNLEGESDLNETSKQIIHENLYIEPEDNGYNIKENQHDKLSDFLDKFVIYCTNNIYELFSKDQEAQIADAILEIFRKRNQIDVFNKKALYIYIREMIDVKTPKITKVADKIYDLFRSKWTFYLEKGYCNF